MERLADQEHERHVVKTGERHSDEQRHDKCANHTVPPGEPEPVHADREEASGLPSLGGRAKRREPQQDQSREHERE